MGEIDRHALVVADEFEGVLDGCEHAEPQQVDLDDSEVRTILFVPLHDAAPGHRRGLDRDDLVEAPRRDHHAAGVLAQMPRQPAHAIDQVEQCGDAWRPGIDTSLLEQARRVRRDSRGAQFVEILAVLEFGNRPGEVVDGVGCHAEHLAHLAHGHARAVGDHDRRHRGTARAVFVEDVLDDLLARFTRGQIEVDVGPLAALFGEKTLEEQIHPYRIDGGDAERVTHSTVGRRATPLGENLLVACELNDVVDDQEVAVQAELLDQAEFVFELRATHVVGWVSRSGRGLRAR